MALGFFCLAADDLFELHEKLDKLVNTRLGFSPDATLPDLLDAGIVAGYGLAATIVLHLQHHHPLGFQGLATGLLKAGGAFVVMVILDVIGDLAESDYARAALEIPEEACKALAISRLFWTFVTARFRLRRPEKCLRAGTEGLAGVTAAAGSAMARGSRGGRSRGSCARAAVAGSRSGRNAPPRIDAGHELTEGYRHEPVDRMTPGSESRRESCWFDARFIRPCLHTAGFGWDATNPCCRR